MTRILAALCLLFTFLTPTAQAHSGHGHRHSHSHHLKGTLLVDNDRLVSASVYVDGQFLGTAGAEQNSRYQVRPGQHDVMIKVAGQRVYRSTMYFSSQQTRTARVAPYEGKLTVVNDTGMPGKLFVDGVQRGVLEPGQRRSMVLDPGTFSVELRCNRYGTLASRRVGLSAGEKETFRAEAPRHASFTLENPLPVSVRVYAGTRAPFVMPAGSIRTLDSVPVGALSLRIETMDGREIDRCAPQIRAYVGADYQIPTPKQGRIATQNLGPERARVYVDGRLVLTLNGYGEDTLTLSTGRHRLVVRAVDGRTLLDTTVIVDPFRVEEVDFGRSRGWNVNVSYSGGGGYSGSVGYSSGYDGDGHQRASGGSSSCTMPY